MPVSSLIRPASLGASSRDQFTAQHEQCMCNHVYSATSILIVLASLIVLAITSGGEYGLATLGLVLQAPLLLTWMIVAGTVHPTKHEIEKRKMYIKINCFVATMILLETSVLVIASSVK